MRPAIKDEFSALPVSRQRKWQLRKHRENKCSICGAPAITSSYCEAHRRAVNLRLREAQRVSLGYKRRNLQSESYHFDEVAA
jgi:hypothetical protein